MCLTRPLTHSYHIIPGLVWCQCHTVITDTHQTQTASTGPCSISAKTSFQCKWIHALMQEKASSIRLKSGEYCDKYRSCIPLVNISYICSCWGDKQTAPQSSGKALVIYGWMHYPSQSPSLAAEMGSCYWEVLEQNCWIEQQCRGGPGLQGVKFHQVTSLGG